MSWQLASFALVLASLAIGFWWYERSRPPAKLVAVIATLAALAALGRDAFAAVPDVKPITAIVLISGLAFGAGPGFIVGAISGLASNVLLGEGPWTPWQMLGWGIVGLIGGALGRLLGERPAPLVLAMGCALAAELFNLVVDLYTWTGTGSHTLAGFGVVLAAALVFDLTHVGASFIFALAFGPALLRMLSRVRLRLAVTWQDAPPRRPPLPPAALAPPLAALIALVVLGTTAGLGPAAQASSGPSATGPAGGGASAHAAGVRAAMAREVAYLRRAQGRDGGFGAAPGQPSSELYSAWAAMGLAAAGQAPGGVSRAGHTVLDALRGEASSLQGAGDLERTILAIRACGVSGRSLRAPGGFVARLLRYRAGDGSFGHLSNLTAFAVLALRAAGYPPRGTMIASAAVWLAQQENGDGGFGFAMRGGSSDVDDTAASLQALAVAHRSAPRALTFLLRAQNLDGGYPQQLGGDSNAQSTAWAVQGLIAAGRDAATVTRAGSLSPLGYLQSLVTAQGSVRYSRTGAQTPVWVTAQALTALAGKPLPIAPVAPSRAGHAAAAGGARPASAAAPVGRWRGAAQRALGVMASAVAALPWLAQAPAHG